MVPPQVCSGSAAVEEAEVAEGVWLVERVVSGGECVVVVVSETVTTQLFGVAGRLPYD